MRLRSALVAAPLLAALACTDAPSPTASSVDALARQSSSGDVCVPPVAVGAITSVYPPRLRGATLQRFQQARALADREGPDAAWPEFLALTGDVLAREAAGTLLDPAGRRTTADAVVLLVDQLYACGGREPVGETIGEVIRNGVDVAITTVTPNEPTQLVVPSANFGVVDEVGSFFDEPALLIIERVPDDPPFVPQVYTEHPPRYRAHVLPASAQANFGRTPVPGDPTILVIICPADPHPALDELTILRIPDAFPADPAQLLDAQQVHGHGVTCTDAGEYPAPQLGAAGSFGGRMFGALRRGAASAFGWLAPQPLYAVDGGIGGRTFFMSSFVAIASPTPEPPPSEDVIVVNDMNLFDDTRMQRAGNRQFASNLVSFTGTGPRAAGTRVIFDRGRDAPCFVATSECADRNQRRFDGVIAAAGLSLTKYDDVRSYAEIPADVKVIVLFTPRVAFTAADAAGLRSFAAEGGRIVFLGEHLRFYGSTGIAVQNDLLQQLGTGMTNVGAQIDCSNRTLPASSLRPHQTTAGVEELLVSCLSRVVLGPTDYAILYSSTGTDVIGGAARIGAPAAVAARADAPPAASARRGALAREIPTVDGDGRPIGTP